MTGLALIVAVATWLAFQAQAPARGMLGAVLAAAAVFALAMIVAGARRRRSGFLAFVSAVLLAIGGVGVGLRTFDELVPPGAFRVPPVGEYEIAQAFGDLNLNVEGWEGGEGTTRVVKGSGNTWIHVQPGVDVRIEITPFAGEINEVAVYGNGGSDSTSHTSGANGRVLLYDGGEGVAQRTIIVDQQSGFIEINDYREVAP